ncbi:MAG: acyltransferase, partial [Singulisphaera sp.]
AACGRFLLARFARIWPCHVLAFVLFCLVNGDTFGSIWQRGLAVPYLANLAMVHSWIPWESFCISGNPPSWTIATEFAFYLLFPLLIWRLDARWHLKLAGCLLLSAGMVAACQLGRVTAEIANGLLYMNPLARVLEFSLGMTTAHLFRTFGPRIRLGRVGETLAELAAFALVAAILYVSSDLVDGVIARSGMSPYVRIWFSRLSLAPASPCSSSWPALGGGGSLAPSSRPGFIFLGEISYSVYLLHIPLLRYFHTREWTSVGVTNWPAFACYLLLLLALSHISWVLVESPARKFLIGLWPRPAVGPRDARPAHAARGVRRVSLPTRLVVASELLLLASFVYATE